MSLLLDQIHGLSYEPKKPEVKEKKEDQVIAAVQNQIERKFKRLQRDAVQTTLVEFHELGMRVQCIHDTQEEMQAFLDSSRGSQVSFIALIGTSGVMPHFDVRINEDHSEKFCFDLKNVTRMLVMEKVEQTKEELWARFEEVVDLLMVEKDDYHTVKNLMRLHRICEKLLPHGHPLLRELATTRNFCLSEVKTRAKNSLLEYKQSLARDHMGNSFAQ